MYYRRKIILSIIELLGGEVEKMRLQKLLFLYAVKKQKPEYDFIPYKYGCYSFSAHADLVTMAKKGILTETDKSYIKSETKNYFNLLKPEDKNLLTQIIADYGEMNQNNLIKHTYINFPFYAINSTIAEKILQPKYLERIIKAKPSDNSIVLFTIGYEGISLEKYLQKLLKNNIKLLVDVRRNPLSMKYGFSKKSLKKYCNSLGIEYVHLPEVGIQSDKRKNLNTQSDYDKLFEEYEQTTLNETLDTQLKILHLLKKHKRIALTCFEAEPCQCHRTRLANALQSLPEFNYEVIHI
jgi:uncharacterized protein (DUF488 family)|tara:strand:+ start:5133 stop:6017 length:885 start_codon:yes stop_codon:yes gene_type:complete